MSKVIVQDNIIYKNLPRIKAGLGIDKVESTMHMCRTSSGDTWRLTITLPSGTVDVELTHAQFSQLLSTQLVQCKPTLRGAARHAGVVKESIHINVNDLPAPVRKEKAWDKHHFSNERFVPLDKYPKLKEYVIDVFSKTKMDACAVYISYSQTATTLTISTNL